MAEENKYHKNDIEVSEKRNAEFTERALFGDGGPAFFINTAKYAEQGLEAVNKGIALGEYRTEYWTRKEKSNRKDIEETRRMTSAFARLSRAVKAYAAAHPQENVERKIGNMLHRGPYLSGFVSDIDEADGGKKGFWKKFKDAANNVFNPNNPKKELNAALKEVVKANAETRVGIDFYRAAQKVGGLTLDNLVKGGANVEKDYQTQLGHDLYQQRLAAELTKDSKKALPAAQSEVDDIRAVRQDAADKIEDAIALRKKVRENLWGDGVDKLAEREAKKKAIEAYKEQTRAAEGTAPSSLDAARLAANKKFNGR